MRVAELAFKLRFCLVVFLSFVGQSERANGQNVACYANVVSSLEFSDYEGTACNIFLMTTVVVVPDPATNNPCPGLNIPVTNR